MHSIPNQAVNLPVLSKFGVTLTIKREDTIHPLVSGNKFRKLKYNIQQALQNGQQTLLTFGGAFSNHLVATACAGKEKGLRTIGMVRGEELEGKWAENPTLSTAAAHGMEFVFVNREDYRRKQRPEFLESLQERYGHFYMLPEGGTNALAVQGCEEILTKEDGVFTHICTAVGTGGTIAGLINSAQEHQMVLGFPALKGGDFLMEDICKFANNAQWSLQTNYHFGGYAKITPALVSFLNEFKRETGIPLDPVYTGKMVYGILDMVAQGAFAKGSKILAIHTGGLQGIAGMNTRLRAKGLPLIEE